VVTGGYQAIMYDSERESIFGASSRKDGAAAATRWLQNIKQ
jgi:hypothetical protein